MTSSSKIVITTLSTAVVFALGLSSAAMAQQGMATATNSELDATWVDGYATSSTSDDASDQGSRAQIASFGYPSNDGVTLSSEGTIRRGASGSVETENGTWVDGSARFTAGVAEGF